MNYMKLILKVMVAALLLALPFYANAQSQLTLHSTGGGSGFGQVLDIGGSPLVDENNDYTLVVMGGTSSDTGTWTTVANIPTSFYSDAAGYIDAGTVSVSSGQTFYYQVYVYDNRTGSSYANATIRGSSGVYSVTLTTPPTAPAAINNFLNFQLVAVPEPTTLALAGMGGIAMLMRRRKKLAA